MSTDDITRRATILTEITDERRRQIEVCGWDVRHDDEHDAGELARAAAAYAVPPGVEQGMSWLDLYTRDMWPWHHDGFRRKDRRTDLIRAAALIVAEIERMDRQP